YDPELYADPESFRPERFLERNYMPFEFLPFGGGHRRCIGAAFAMYEMAIVLGTMLKHYDFTLHETKPVVSVRRSVTFGPSSPIRASIKPRANV
ncbi:MAG: cytochrome P450, partial [Pirellulales bacterium]